MRGVPQKARFMVGYFGFLFKEIKYFFFFITMAKW